MILLSFFVLSLGAHGLESDNRTEAPTATYGQAYILDQPAIVPGDQTLSLTVGLEAGDPLRDTYNTTLNYNYHWNTFFSAGLLARLFISDESSTLDSVEQSFGLLGVDLSSEKPKHSLYAIIGFTPIQGRVNLMSKSSLMYSLGVSAGLGQRTTNEDSYGSLIWTVHSTVEISSSWSLLIQYSQEAEALIDSRKTLLRDQINIGVTYRL